MTFRPGIPLHHNSSASLDGSRSLSISGASVADDIASRIGIRSNISKIGGRLSPTDNGRRISLVGVLVNEISSVPTVH